MKTCLDRAYEHTETLKGVVLHLCSHSEMAGKMLPCPCCDLFMEREGTE